MKIDQESFIEPHTKKENSFEFSFLYFIVPSKPNTDALPRFISYQACDNNLLLEFLLDKLSID